MNTLLRAILLVIGMGTATSVGAATGLDWLATQQNSDGSFGNTPTSLATPIQSTAEVLRAYQMLGQVSGAGFSTALSYLNSDTETDTEYLARKIIVNAKTNNTVTPWVNQLVTRQNPDGGFGDAPGYDSSVLATALALEALALANYTAGQSIAGAVGFLMNHQLANGGWRDEDNEASVYLSALAMRTLSYYRNAFTGVAAALTKAQNFLLSQRASDGSFGENFVTALALTALIPNVADLSLVTDSANTLRANQSANGSWNDDTYTTALAVQAMRAFEARQAGVSPTNGSVTGYVTKANSTEPIPGAAITVSEMPGISLVSNGEGFFSIPGLPVGRYTVTARKAGYTSASVVAVTQAGQVTLAGNLVLDVAAQTGLVQGKVFDAATLAPINAVQVTLSGPTSLSVLTDTAGNFAVGPVSSGSYTLSFQKSGYSSVNAIVAVIAGEVLTTQMGLTLAGGFADDTPGTVQGRIVNAKTSAPITGAVVSLGGVLTATTGIDGQFSVASVPRGTYQGTVSATGYQSLNFSAVYPAGSNGNLGTISLYPATVSQPPTTLTLHGLLTDGISGAPIGGASVNLVETGASATTGVDGRFLLSGITLTTFSLSLSATGYVPATQTLQVSAFGDAEVHLRLSPPGSGATTSSLAGAVSDAQTGAAIAGAQVAISGTSLTAITGGDGRYSISEVAGLEFTVNVSAVGYGQQSSGVKLAAPGNYTLNPLLNPLAADSFQIVSVTANQSQVVPNSTALFSARVASLLNAPASVLVIGEIQDATGTAIAMVIPYAEGTTIPTSQFSFGPGEIKDLTIPWNTAQFAPAAYKLVLRAVEPDSISRALPLGQVLAENSAYTDVGASAAIDGALAINPPLAQAGLPTPVVLSAIVRNAGNVPLAEANYTLSVSRSDTNVVLFTAQATGPTLEVGVNTTVDFGTWVPTESGNLQVRVRSKDAAVTGTITDRLYVGDKASGTFTVNKTVVPEGTQVVRGKISMQGVDVRSGGSTDPLFPIVKEAVRRGGVFTAPGAVNWHLAGRCLGCHIQSQSLFGLASSLDKADIDVNATKFLYNAVAGSLQADGGLRISHPTHTKVQTALGLWSLVAWPDKAASFRTKYFAAKHMHDRRSELSNRTFWNSDHGSGGWWDTQVSMTSLVSIGMADVLRSAQEIDLTGVKDYELVNLQPAGAGGAVRDLELGPDGALYALRLNGAINRIDLTTGQTTTVATVTGVTSTNTGLAVGADGSYYATGDHGRLIRVAASGTQTTLYSQSGGILRDVEIGPDNLLYVSDQSLNRILKFNVNGQLQGTITSGLFNQPNGMAFDNQGTLFVANRSGFNLLKIAPTGAVSIHANGLAYPPLAVTVHDDGSLYVVSESFSKDGQNTPFGAYRIAASGVAERIYSGSTLRGVLSHAGKVLVTNETSNTLSELRTKPLDSNLFSAYTTDLVRAGAYFLSNFQDGTSDNVVQGMRMIGMAEVASIVTDPSLKAQLNSAVTFAGNLLRARQRADGGWGRSVNQASDPLITALVGIAIDYTHPSSDDPQIRKAIQYLLNTQSFDGGWNNVNNVLTTRLAATSFVMAYLPKALERLGGIDVDLHLDVAANVTLSNPSMPPTTVIPSADGGKEYIWKLLGVTVAGRNVEFDLTLLNMALNEQRAVARKTYLEFANSFVNEKIQLALDIPVVRAASGITLSVVADKANYQPNEPASVNSTVANTGPTPVSAQVVLALRAPDSTANLLEFPPLPVDNLATGAQQLLQTAWNTGAILAGSYQIVGRVIDAQGRVLAESVAPINIGAPAVVVTTSVTTDKPVYGAWDTVTLTGRVRNAAPNAILAPSRVELKVQSPSGDTLYFDTRTVNELVPGALVDLTFTLNLVDAVNGQYPVTLVLKDAFTRTVLSTSNTTFQVERRILQSVTGNVTVNAPQVFRGDSNICSDTAKNVAGSAVMGVKLIHQLVNVDAGVVVAETPETVNLPAGGLVSSYIRNIDTRDLSIGGYACVLQAELNGDTRTLSFAGFRVLEPPIKFTSDLHLGAKGRLLVLLDNGRHRHEDGEDDDDDGHEHDDDEHEHKDKDGHNGHDHDHNNTAHDDRDPHGPQDAPGLAAQRAFLEKLLKDAGWSYTITVTARDFTRELHTGGYSVYALLSEQEKLSETVQKELREAVFRGEGLVVAGVHDNRNLHHKRLNDALGLKVSGSLRQAKTVILSASDLGLTGEIALIPGDKALRIKRLTAVSAGVYPAGTRSQSEDDCRKTDDHDKHVDKRVSKSSNDNKSEDQDDDDDNEHEDHEKCETNPAGALDAVTLNAYGQGQTAFTGFDLLAQATRDGDVSLAAQLLTKLLSKVHPIAFATGPGAVVPIALTLKNQGVAVSINATLTLPPGVSVIDAGTGQASGQLLTWTFPLAVDEQKTVTAWIRLSDQPGPITLNASVTASAGSASLTANPSLTVTITALEALSSIKATLAALAQAGHPDKKALAKAIRRLDKALSYDSGKAVAEALKATDALLGLTDPVITNLRAGIDAWLRQGVLNAY